MNNIGETEMEKRSIIREILLGNEPFLQNIKQSTKCKNLLNKVSKNLDCFQDKLSEDLKAEFEIVINSIENLHTEELIEYYVNGVKLGTRFTMEVLP